MIESFQFANSVKTVSNNTDSPDAQTEQPGTSFEDPLLRNVNNVALFQSTGAVFRSVVP